MFNPVCWFEIYVQDMDRAKKFYEAILEQTLEKIDMPGMDMWMFKSDDKQFGTGGALVKMEGVLSGACGTLVYFTTQDCEVAAERVQANGGKIYRPKFSIDKYGFISLVHDTEGNMIGLHSLQ